MPVGLGGAQAYNLTMISRFHFPGRLPAAGELQLPDALAHHAVRVLRLRDGERIVLFDGEGGEAEATLQVRGKAAWAQVEARREVDRESPLQIVLVQALASGDKMDWVVQKAVEMGASAIQPVQAERSVLRLAGERAQKKVAHWQAVAVAACEQSGRTRVPGIAPVRGLGEWLAALPAAGDELRLVLSLRDAQPLRQGTARAVLALSGPEGGLGEAEEEAARRAGFTPLSLGPRTLRADTAPLALLARLGAAGE